MARCPPVISDSRQCNRQLQRRFQPQCLRDRLDSRVNFVQALPTIYRLAATVPVVSQFSAVVADDLISGFHFPSLGTRFGGAARFGELDFDFRTKSVSIGAGLPFLSAMVTSNSFDPRRATVLGISLRTFHAW